jgi:plasmid stabilization system protein ParE
VAPWVVVVSDLAEHDLRAIGRWTRRKFGQRQAERYLQSISAAITTLAAGPATPGPRSRTDLPLDILALHTRGTRSRGRHVVLCRCHEHTGQRVAEVLRVLHEMMDLPRHLDPTD